MSVPFTPRCPYVSEGRRFCLLLTYEEIQKKFNFSSCWNYEYGNKHTECEKFKQKDKILLNRKLKKLKNEI